MHTHFTHQEHKLNGGNHMGRKETKQKKGEIMVAEYRDKSSRTWGPVPLISAPRLSAERTAFKSPALEASQICLVNWASKSAHRKYIFQHSRAQQEFDVLIDTCKWIKEKNGVYSEKHSHMRYLYSEKHSHMRRAYPNGRGSVHQKQCDEAITSISPVLEIPRHP